MRLRWDSVTASLGKPCLPRGSRSFAFAERRLENTSQTVEESRNPVGDFVLNDCGRPEADSGVEPDRLLAIRPDADQADRDTDEIGDEAKIVACLLGQVCGAAAGAEVNVEARQLLVLRRRRVEDRLVV